MPSYDPIKEMKQVDKKLRISKNLLKLREQLNQEIPKKTAKDTMLIATWNIRNFGDNRMWESLHYIAEIIDRFDLIAIQEVSTDMKGLEKLMSLLEPNWDYLVTDSTDGSRGGWERMAFLYDKSKIKFKNLAGEIVLPKEKLINDGLQFARTPYCVAYQAEWFKFIITTVHIFYGSTSAADMEKREKEIDTLTNLLATRSKKENESYILLGDFNIPNVEDKTMKALEKYGFSVPEAIKEHPTDLGKSKHYDQIAFNLKLDKKMTIFSENEQKAGAFNFAESVYTKDDLKVYKECFDEKILAKSEKEIETYYMSKWRTFEMSDHLPLWVELKIDFSNQYLEKIIKSP